MELENSRSLRNNVLDPHEQPPEDMKELFKKWKKVRDSNPLPQESELLSDDWCLSQSVDLEKSSSIFNTFEDTKAKGVGQGILRSKNSNRHLVQFYDSKILPGLKIIPNFLSISSQSSLLDRLLNRDLSNSTHTTNLDLHFEIEYPSPNKSFFDYEKQDTLFKAKDPDMHRDLTMDRVLTRKLRWMTLGGQYDWTRKEYPQEAPPKFPSDIYDLLHESFPDMEPEAAIVNFYSPGDTLSLHRDVSEDADRGLVSISIGCDAIFIIGLSNAEDGKSRYQILRLKSGDAVYMSGESRYAWHAVPSIVPNTCPKQLEDWPATSHPVWKDYMKTKRINLNVRQMYASSNPNNDIRH